MGILVASEQISGALAEEALFVGELALDGAVRHVRGVLPIAAYARDHGYRALYVPAADASEAALIPGLEVIPVANLLQLVDHLTGHESIGAQPQPALDEDDGPCEMDFCEVRGQTSNHSGLQERIV